MFIPLSYSKRHPMLIKQRAVKVKRVITYKSVTLTKWKRYHLKDFILFDRDISTNGK